MKTIATFLSTGTDNHNYDVGAMTKPKVIAIALCIDSELVNCVERVFEWQVSLIPVPSAHINRDVPSCVSLNFATFDLCYPLSISPL